MIKTRGKCLITRQLGGELFAINTLVSKTSVSPICILSSKKRLSSPNAARSSGSDATSCFFNQSLKPFPESSGAVSPFEQIRVAAFARLITPPPRDLPDTLVDVSEASKRLGMSTSYLYRNHENLAFTRRVGRSLRFSTLGIAEHLRRKTSLTLGRQRV